MFDVFCRGDKLLFKGLWSDVKRIKRNMSDLRNSVSILINILISKWKLYICVIENRQLNLSNSELFLESDQERSTSANVEQNPM